MCAARKATPPLPCSPCSPPSQALNSASRPQRRFPKAVPPPDGPAIKSDYVARMYSGGFDSPLAAAPGRSSEPWDVTSPHSPRCWRWR